MAIEIRQTKRTIAYRAVVASGEAGTTQVSKTFRTRAAAVAWEREMLAEQERTEREAGASSIPAD
jgi:hypothetical protein